MRHSSVRHAAPVVRLLGAVEAAIRASAPGRLLAVVLVGAGLVGALGAAAGHAPTGAIFDNSDNVPNAVSAKRIFPGTRVTSGFVVSDVSGGSAIDRSSAYAAAGDGRTKTSKAWSAAFAAGRYLQFDMSAPLPGGLAVTSPALQLTFASAGATTACVYLEVRRISTDAVVATYGSGASPSACVTGTTAGTFAIPLPIVSSTDLANDLRIRALGRESGSAGMLVDEARVTGSTPYVAFATYPVRFTDAGDGVPLTTPWDLQGP
jgi:hypothetical protein